MEHILHRHRGRGLSAVFIAVCLSSIPSAWCGTLVQMSATGSQPTVITPQGKVKTLYKDSYAILISESGYGGAANQGWRPLDNTPREVDSLALVLQRHGFNIWRVSDATGDELRGHLRDFIAEYGQNEDNRLFFFFSGHGYTNERTELGYLVPVDAMDPNIDFPQFLRAALPIAEIELLAKEVESRHALFVFDSCFSGTIFTSKSASMVPIARGAEANDRWRFLTGKSAQAVRQFISAGGPKETLPAKSIFLPLLRKALDGEASNSRDGYVTGKEIGLWLEQQVPSYNPNQNPQSSVIRVPNLSFGDMVFQYEPVPVPGDVLKKVQTLSLPSQTDPGKVFNTVQDQSPPSKTKLTYSLDLAFAPDKADLTPEHKEKLEDMVIGMREATLEIVTVVGVADKSEGNTAAYAARVAMMRAESVKAFLVAGGIPPNRIDTSSGIADPAPSAAERSQHRLVKVEVIATKVVSQYLH